jgi:hypothetical protein
MSTNNIILDALIVINKDYDLQIKEYQDNKRIILNILNNLSASSIRQQPNISPDIIRNLFTSIFNNAPQQEHVIRGFTPNQIQQLTKLCTYSSIQNPINTECPILLTEFQPTDQVVQLNKCKHIFNKEPIYEALSRDSRCPCCRTDLNNEEEIRIEFVTI